MGVTEVTANLGLFLERDICKKIYFLRVINFEKKDFLGGGANLAPNFFFQRSSPSLKREKKVFFFFFLGGANFVLPPWGPGGGGGVGRAQTLFF